LEKSRHAPALFSSNPRLRGPQVSRSICHHLLFITSALALACSVATPASGGGTEGITSKVVAPAFGPAAVLEIEHEFHDILNRVPSSTEIEREGEFEVEVEAERRRRHHGVRARGGARQGLRTT
jgi:hypothetical protein